MANFFVNIFNPESFDKAIDFLDKHCNLKLNKLEKALYLIAEMGLEEMKHRIAISDNSNAISTSKHIERSFGCIEGYIEASAPNVYVQWKTNKGEITESGGNLHGYEVNPLLIAEFGSGHLVDNKYPDKMPDMVEGSLSTTVGYGQVAKGTWSYVDVNSNERIWTSGQEATHPIYMAGQRMREELKKIKGLMEVSDD